MNILGIDFETTGLTTEDRVIEAGIVIWNTKKKTYYHCVGDLLYAEEYPSIGMEAWKVHGISNEEVKAFGVHPLEFFSKIPVLMERYDCEAYCGHNVRSFDKRFLVADSERYNHPEWLADLPWIDTMKDLPEDPRQGRTKALTYMALDHGIYNSFKHRSIADVLTTFQLLSCYRIEDVLANMRTPTYLVKAQVDYNTKELAKAFGFKWKDTPMGKAWVKEVKKTQFEKEQSSYSFGVHVLDENV